MRRCCGLIVAAALWCGFSVSSSAQTQNGSFGHIGPSTGEIVGIIVGASVAIGVVVYLVIPKQKTIEGCVESSNGGLMLTTNGNQQTYALTSSNVTLQVGKRVKVKGKRGRKNESGAREFAVKRLVRDEGGCS